MFEEEPGRELKSVFDSGAFHDDYLLFLNVMFIKLNSIPRSIASAIYALPCSVSRKKLSQLNIFYTVYKNIVYKNIEAQNCLNLRLM